MTINSVEERRPNLDRKRTVVSYKIGTKQKRMESYNHRDSYSFVYQENHSIDDPLISMTEAFNRSLDKKLVAMGVVYWMTHKRPFILLIITFCFPNLKTMELEVMHFGGLNPILQKEQSLFQLMVEIQNH